MFITSSILNTLIYIDYVEVNDLWVQHFSYYISGDRNKSKMAFDKLNYLNGRIFTYQGSLMFMKMVAINTIFLMNSRFREIEV